MPSCPTCDQSFSAGTTLCPTDGSVLLDDLEDAPSRPSTDVPEGMTVGEYRIEVKLGEGGFGAVYRARHPLIGKTAAIKVLSHEFSARPDVASRFVAEARAVNQIQNKNIVDIFSFGTLPDGRLYYIMELLQGEGFDAYLERHDALDVRTAMPIFRAVARALDAAHAKGIFHRDLKPENVFLKQEEDGTIVPKLLDFGIAKLSSDIEKAHKTRTGVAIGTPSFMSPEQSKGEDIDGRTDVYAFGVLVYVTLTGVLPFTGNSTVEILMKQITEPAKAPSSVRPGLPPEIDAPILAMMAKDRNERPRTVGLALDSLCAALGIATPTTTASVEMAATIPPAAHSEPRSGFSRPGAARDRTATAATIDGGRLSNDLATAASSARTEMNMEAPVPKKRGTLVWAFVAAGLLGVVGAGAFIFLRSSGSDASQKGAAGAGLVSTAGPTSNGTTPPGTAPTAALTPIASPATPLTLPTASATTSASAAKGPPLKAATTNGPKPQHKDIPKFD
ncbi:MAG: serine/threonine-protein kinase [Polyangiaceae bacterium]